MNNTKENKYVINLIFNRPYQLEEGSEVEVIPEITSLGYQTFKDARDAYNKFNRRGYLELTTPTGTISFNLITVELIDLTKYSELLNSEVDNNEVNNEE